MQGKEPYVSVWWFIIPSRRQDNRYYDEHATWFYVGWCQAFL